MAAQEHPCGRGLARDCWDGYPLWASRALAYRTIHTLVPAGLTRRLPGPLGKPLIGAGATIPRGVIVPTGVTIPPDFDFPVAWTPWLYLNIAPYLDPQTPFPEDWSPGDPLPKGITIDDPTMVPPTWNPHAHPRPTHLLPPRQLVVIPEAGPSSPLYSGTFEPGPLIQPGKNPSPKVVIFFNEPFDDLTTNSWIEQIVPPASISVVDGILIMAAESWGKDCRVYRTSETTIPSHTDTYLKLNVESGTGVLYFSIYTGTHSLQVRWKPPKTIGINGDGGYEEFELDDFADQNIVWRFDINGLTLNLYRDGVLQVANHTILTETGTPGVLSFLNQAILTTRIDYLTIYDLT